MDAKAAASHARPRFLQSVGVKKMARAILTLGICLLSVGAICGTENGRVTVKTSPGPPRVTIGPNQSRVVVRGVNIAITNNYTHPLTAFVI